MDIWTFEQFEQHTYLHLKIGISRNSISNYPTASRQYKRQFLLKTSILLLLMNLCAYHHISHIQDYSDIQTFAYLN